MYSFSLEDLTLPFELSENERSVIQMLQHPVGTHGLPNESLRKLKLAIAKGSLAEEMIKVILTDPSLLELAEVDDMKEYWQGYIKSCTFVYDIFSYNYLIAKKPYQTNSAEKTYNFQIREDLSYAEQAIALFCLIQYTDAEDPLIRHQWRMLAAKHGSLLAALGAHQKALGQLREMLKRDDANEESVQKTMTDVLMLLSETSKTHGAPALFCFAYYCNWLWHELYLENDFKPLLEASYTAFLLAGKLLSLPYCQISFQNATFGGTQDKFYQMHFTDFDLRDYLTRTPKNFSPDRRDALIHIADEKSAIISTMFSLPTKTPAAIEALASLSKMTLLI